MTRLLLTFFIFIQTGFVYGRMERLCIDIHLSRMVQRGNWWSHLLTMSNIVLMALKITESQTQLHTKRVIMMQFYSYVQWTPLDNLNFGIVCSYHQNINQSTFWKAYRLRMSQSIFLFMNLFVAQSLCLFSFRLCQ